MIKLTYTARLDIEAQVPEDPSLQAHFNYSIAFDILCPIAACDSIKKNGKDPRNSLRPQWFYCKVHRVSFYAYTSWLMARLSEIVIQRILLSLFRGKSTAVQLAKQYHISPSVISNLIQHCQEYVDYILAKIKEEQQSVKQTANFSNTASEKIIWLDEIFFKVGGSSLPLIIAINGNYQVVGWKLGKTRKAEDIVEVLTQVSQAQPNWNVLVGDGAQPYPKALVLMKKDAYLIQHVHSKPWHVSRIHKFEVLPDSSITQSIIELQYNAFVSADPQVGYALEKTHPPPKKGKKGRPKGSKNKNKSKEPKEPKLRGPKTAKKHGTPFKLNNDDKWLEVAWFDEGFATNHARKSNTEAPSLTVIQELVLLSFIVFRGGAIVSNLIESMNSVVRNSVPDRGVKTEIQLRHHIKPVMELNSGISENTHRSMVVPVAKRIGFTNLGQFMTPQVSLIDVRVGLGGD